MTEVSEFFGNSGAGPVADGFGTSGGDGHADEVGGCKSGTPPKRRILGDEKEPVIKGVLRHLKNPKAAITSCIWGKDRSFAAENEINIEETKQRWVPSKGRKFRKYLPL